MEIKGYHRYKKDTREVEEYIEKVHQKEQQNARDSFIRLRKNMEQNDKKIKDKEEEFVKQAEEAKLNLKTIEKDIKKKEDFHSRTIDTIKSNCKT